MTFEADSSAAYQAFLEACYAEAKDCPLARKDVNTTDTAIRGLFRRLRDEGGVIVQRNATPAILTSGMARCESSRAADPDGQLHIQRDAGSFDI